MTTQAIPAADYSHFGKIKVTGEDRVSVLHHILTQDIKNLPSGSHAPAALLSHNGKIQLYMEVYRFENFLILVLENQPAEAGIAKIEKYIIAEDAQLEDVTETYSFVQTFSPNPEKLLYPKSQIAELIQKQNLVLVTPEQAAAFSIEHTIPRYGIDMDENTILSETGLEKVSVSDTKGCYPGQEVVARIETYKGLTKKLTKFQLDGTRLPQAGDKIFKKGEETAAGWITSAELSPSVSKLNALGYLTKGYFGSPLEVEIKSGGEMIQGETV